MNTSGTRSGSVPASREVEAMLWRAAVALGADEARADEALAAVCRAFARPAGASESRMLAVVIESVAGSTGSSSLPGDVASRLVHGAGVPADVVVHALGKDEGGQRVSEEDGVVQARERVRGADVAAALARVDALTAGLRRRRLALNVLKYAAFVFVLGLVVFVMFDLREAARKEKAGLTPGDLYSLPMPKGK